MFLNHDTSNTDWPETGAASAVTPAHCAMSGPPSPLRTHLAALLDDEPTLRMLRELGEQGGSP